MSTPAKETDKNPKTSSPDDPEPKDYHLLTSILQNNPPSASTDRLSSSALPPLTRPPALSLLIHSALHNNTLLFRHLLTSTAISPPLLGFRPADNEAILTAAIRGGSIDIWTAILQQDPQWKDAEWRGHQGGVLEMVVREGSVGLLEFLLGEGAAGGGEDGELMGYLRAVVGGRGEGIESGREREREAEMMECLERWERGGEGKGAERNR